MVSVCFAGGSIVKVVVIASSLLTLLKVEKHFIGFYFLSHLRIVDLLFDEGLRDELLLGFLT